MANVTADPHLDEVLLDPRVRAVLADLDQLPGRRWCRCGAGQGGSGLAHWDGCWQHHVGCLAARIHRHLTEGTPQ